MSTSKELRGCIVRWFSQFVNEIVVRYDNILLALFARTCIFGVLQEGKSSDPISFTSTNGPIFSDGAIRDTSVSFCSLRDIVFVFGTIIDAVFEHKKRCLVHLELNITQYVNKY